MGRELWAAYPVVRPLFDEASELVEQDLKTLCFEGPEATLVQTDHVQPAITLVNLAVLRVLRDEGVEPIAAAGHSLGEYSALCAAGVFSFADTMRLVQFRGAVMKQAADRHPGGMTAVFGLDMDTLSAICVEASESGSVEIANHNSPRQVILTGDRDALQRAADLAKQQGAKLIVPLKVSGPWHSRFMTAARERMREALRDCAVNPPTIPVLSNVTAEPYPDDPNAIRAGLVEQMVNPVQWSSSMNRLLQDGHRLFVEVGPGKVLTGLMRDIDRGASVFVTQDGASLTKLLASRYDAIPS
jgi:[acyl-carrier-protein] S-malonyltransferase